MASRNEKDTQIESNDNEIIDDSKYTRAQGLVFTFMTGAFVGKLFGSPYMYYFGVGTAGIVAIEVLKRFNANKKTSKKKVTDTNITSSIVEIVSSWVLIGAGIVLLAGVAGGALLTYGILCSR